MRRRNVQLKVLFRFSPLILGNAVGGFRALCQYTFGIRQLIVWMWSASSKQTRLASSVTFVMALWKHVQKQIWKNPCQRLVYLLLLPSKCNSQSYSIWWLLLFSWSVFRPNGFERGEQMRSPRWSVIPSFIFAASSLASPSPTSSTSPGPTNDSAPSTRRTRIPRGKPFK